MQTVLIIDDNEGIRTALEVLFSIHDVRTRTASSPDEGLAILDNELVDLLIQDMNFTEDTTSGDEGVALFRRVRERNPDLPVILLTAWSNLETAVELVKAGAADYLSKPWDDAKLLTSARNLLQLSALQREVTDLGAQFIAAICITTGKTPAHRKPVERQSCARSEVRFVRNYLSQRCHAPCC